MFSLRHALMGSVAACVMAAASPALAEVQSFDIPAQPAQTAIQEFGRQSGLQILASQTDVGGQTVRGIKGQYEPREALRRMLLATNLRIASDDGRTVTLAPQSGSAAGDGADGTVQALVVTAQKREENIQDVPIAMSAFTQEDLTRSQVAGGPDLMTQVPNFTFTKTNFSGYSIQIRGIGTQAISATTDPAVAVAFNNTPLVRNRFFEQEFYDLQRVEVLRGPQGTLYGRNATAGVVNIISAKPSFHYEAKLSADLANYNSTRLEGMVNIPLVEDAVALRLAGAWTKRDGYATNQLTGHPIDGRDLWSTRLSLRIAPSDAFNANLVWEHFEEKDDRLRSGKQLCKKDLRTELGGFPIPDVGSGIGTPAALYTQGCAAASLYSDESFQTPNGYALPYYLPLFALGLPAVGGLDPYLSATQSRDLRVIESSIDPKYTAKSDVAELQVSANLSDRLTITSETAYSTDNLWSMQDYNRFTTTPHAFGVISVPFPRENLLSSDGVYCDPQLGCSDRVLVADVSTAKSTQFSQEFRLSSNFDGSFNFNVGANFLRYDTEDKYYVFINTVTLTGASLNVLRSPPPWVVGVSDNHPCLPKLTEGDSTRGQELGITNCLYIDPNPIDSVNDLGHNYFLSRNPYKLISYALFGEAYYELARGLKITGGLRWTVDKKEAPEIPSWLLAPLTIGYPVRSVVRQEWREPTGRVAIDWKPTLSFTDETLIYGSFAHGYKAGGANPPPATIVSYGPADPTLIEQSLTHPKTFEPEFVNAFEIGTKNTLSNGHLTFNLSAFYYDYKNYQISEIVDRAAVNHNYDASVWGAEAEIDWRPVENLRLGFKGGYENTRVADGMQGIDLMDRTAGHSDWIVVRPFATVPSNCILPVYILVTSERVWAPGEESVPNGGPCAMAYLEGLDPVTHRPYVANPQSRLIGGIVSLPLAGTEFEGYPGFDPRTAPNHGEGFAKDLSGNELPNAPRFTATGTIDYTLPLADDWLMTLHADLYWQDKAWARIFNYAPYDRLKAYTNVNFAAIFTNESAGWQVMAYVKNAFDKDNITGAFLNSDDTGLTTNVFLNEPRLFGLRVTKQWSDLPWNLGSHHAGLYPLTIEIGGSVPRQTADNDPFTVDALSAFSSGLLPDRIQSRDLDWGDGREVRVSYAPQGGPWRLSAAVRFGKANKFGRDLLTEPADHGGCIFVPICEASDPKYSIPSNSSWTEVREKGDFALADFRVGKNVGLGALSASELSAGLGYAHIKSKTDLMVKGIPDWDVANFSAILDNSYHHWYESALTSGRDFEGAGPVVSWDASKALLGNERSGHLDVAWTIGGGVLFGRQTANLEGDVLSNSYVGRYGNLVYPAILLDSTTTTINRHRSKSVSVPTVNASLGLAYEIDRFKISSGYRWERYFDAIDGGDRERRTFDRTFDGPYFRLSVGFGGG